MKKYIFILAIVILAIGFMATLPEGKLTPENIRYVKVAGQRVKVDLAISEEAQAKGLGGRAALAEGEGMLFIFDTPSKKRFWMEDMKFPIDIIWVSDSMQIIYIDKNVLPESYPERFGPDAYVKYVLEVPAGFSEKHKVKIGDPITLSD